MAIKTILINNYFVSQILITLSSFKCLSIIKFIFGPYPDSTFFFNRICYIYITFQLSVPEYVIYYNAESGLFQPLFKG